jgi:hypothetical protein
VVTPIFKLDSKEKYRPQPVETIEMLGRSAGAALSLDALPANSKFILPTRPPDVTDTPVVGYHRAVKGGPLWWHQFWLWYLCNNWEIAGIGIHEGDWEFVQLGCVDRAGDQPVLLTCSQHKNGGKREVWACEQLAGRPVVYVAVGSHANYPKPLPHSFEHALFNHDDRADGKGRLLDEIEWRDFDPKWADWKGRWGNSDSSPKSPGTQGTRWNKPHVYHAGAEQQ